MNFYEPKTSLPLSYYTHCHTWPLFYFCFRYFKGRQFSARPVTLPEPHAFNKHPTQSIQNQPHSLGWFLWIVGLGCNFILSIRLIGFAIHLTQPNLSFILVLFW